jgi:hypothetical protein
MGLIQKLDLNIHPKAKLKGAPWYLTAAILILLIAAEVLSFRWTHRFAMFLTGDPIDSMNLAVVMSVGKTALGVVAVGYLAAGQRFLLHCYVGTVILLSIAASLGNMAQMDANAHDKMLNSSSEYQRLKQKRDRLVEKFDSAKVKEARNSRSKFIAVRNQASIQWKKGEFLPDGSIALANTSATDFYENEIDKIDIKLIAIEANPAGSSQVSSFLRAGAIFGMSAAGAVKAFYDVLVSVILDLYAPLCLWLLGVGLKREPVAAPAIRSEGKRTQDEFEKKKEHSPGGAGHPEPKLSVVKKTSSPKPRRPKIDRNTTHEEDYVEARKAIVEGRLKPSVRNVEQFVRRGTKWARLALKKMTEEGVLVVNMTESGKVSGYRIVEAA